MAAADDALTATGRAVRGRRRSFSPRYPAWLTSPSLLYYAIFFLGPLAILVAFSLATQTGSTRSPTASTPASTTWSPTRST